MLLHNLTSLLLYFFNFVINLCAGILRKAEVPCSASGIAQDEPHGKVFFTFLGGLACDLEGLGACAGQFLKPRLINSNSKIKGWQNSFANPYTSLIRNKLFEYFLHFRYYMVASTFSFYILNHHRY